MAPSLEVVLIDAKRRELAGGRSYEGTREPYVQGVLIRMALAPPLFPSLFGLLLFFGWSSRLGRVFLLPKTAPPLRIDRAVGEYLRGPPPDWNTGLAAA